MGTLARWLWLAPLLFSVAAVPVPAAAADHFLKPPGVSVLKSSWKRWVKSAEGQEALHTPEIPQRDAVFLNSLVLERSPYLLQHANNPVNWVGWSEQSLADARSKATLIFLSIGYSTCHWCHVMNRESFSDPEIAELINRHFVAIKVDREELPVVDQHYSNTLALVKGSAGWPLTAVLDADGQVIVIDSYLDPEALTKTLRRIIELARTRPEVLEQSAGFIASLTTTGAGDAPGDAEPVTLGELSQIVDAIVARMDPAHGGLAGQQKFPNEALLNFLLTVEARQMSEKLRNALALQLTAMATGGLYDPVNGGFFRYATEPTWQNPHYEKMLYNQAQLLKVYSKAYARFGDSLYAWVVRDTERFLYGWLHEPGQGFYSAIDAESEGVEGGYYLWEEVVIDSLGGEAANAAGLTTYAAYGKEHLQGVLLAKPEKPAAETIRDLLLQARQHRPRPFVDKKILAAWNAAALSGLAAAWWHAPPDERGEAIKRLAANGEALWARLYDEQQQKLLRASYAGGRTVPGTLEDYAFMLRATLDLYDVTADRRWLQRAGTLADRLLDEFLDDSGHFRLAGIRSRAQLGTDAIALDDTELPAADAVAVGALWRLWKRTGSAELKRALAGPISALRRSFRAAPYRRLFAGHVLADIDLGSTAHLQFFAGGRGKVAVGVAVETAGVDSVCDTATVSVALADGWHVNSSEPLQDYLLPTAIAVSRPEDASLSIDYPQGRIVKLGFQDEALSVYDGKFDIGISSEDCTPWSAGGELTIDLQACSDEICLLPEVVRVRLPGFEEPAPAMAD